MARKLQSQRPLLDAFADPDDPRIFLSNCRVCKNVSPVQQSAEKVGGRRVQVRDVGGADDQEDEGGQHEVPRGLGEGVRREEGGRSGKDPKQF